MGAILKTELEYFGAHVESVPAVAPALGDNVVATLTGTGKGHVLLIAHMDTVFQVKASMTRNFPPWPPAASTDALLARAQKLYAEIGGKLAGVPVGSSADVAFAAETRTPSIDGVAILGGGAHGVDDHADLSSVVPRVYLLTRMLMDLGHNPPVKTRKDRRVSETLRPSN